ncbi:hypothetical protein HFD88_003280 [Aspergillus terreus]|nr:hypothetical protein HFD88_003280 [Aspergillus terreus]
MSTSNRAHRRRTPAPNNTANAVQDTPSASPSPSTHDLKPSPRHPAHKASRKLSQPPRQPGTGHVSTQLAPPWPFNPSETALIRAGYLPAFKPKPSPSTTADNDKHPEANSKPKPTPKMAEPRARAARHKGQMNFASELRLLLLAYGDPSPHPSFPAEPLPETVRVLDEIVTDFVLEMCHGAAQYASYSRRQKIKVDDFRFALRRDPNKLGRVQELLRMERELKEARKAFDQNDDQVGNLKDAGKKGLEELGEAVDGKKSKGKGKRGVRRDSDAGDDASSKKRKTG